MQVLKILILISLVLVLFTLVFVVILDRLNVPIPARLPVSKLTEEQARKLVKRCGGSTVMDADGNERCFFTEKDKQKIGERKRRKLVWKKKEQQKIKL